MPIEEKSENDDDGTLVVEHYGKVFKKVDQTACSGFEHVTFE